MDAFEQARAKFFGLPHFRPEKHGSVCMLRPAPTAAREWVFEKVDPNSEDQPCFPTVVIEPSYVEAILEGVRQGDFESSISRGD